MSTSVQSQPTAPLVPPVDIAEILVAIDGGDDAARVVAVASSLATAVGATVRLVGVAAPGSDDTVLCDTLEAVGHDRGVAREVIVAERVAPALMAAAASVPGTVLCMASHGRGRSAGLVGSVTMEVASHTTAPLLVVGPKVESGHTFTDRVVACVDGGAVSEQVVGPATVWARKLALPLWIMTIAEPVPEPVGPGGRYHRSHGPDVDADDYITSLVERSPQPGVVVRGHAAYNPISVVDGLNDQVEGQHVGLFVATTHARTGVPRLVLGSVTSDIIRHLPVPVLLVPVHER